jgi:hypothetical protein
MEYLHYILTVIGIGWFTNKSSLMMPMRKFIAEQTDKDYTPFMFLIKKLNGILSCIFCASFWIGLGVFFTIDIQCVYLEAVFSAFSVLGTVYIVENVFAKN